MMDDIKIIEMLMSIVGVLILFALGLVGYIWRDTREILENFKEIYHKDRRETLGFLGRLDKQIALLEQKVL